MDGGVWYHRGRRRGARRPPQGPDGQRHAVRELDGRGGAAAPRGAHGRLAGSESTHAPSCAPWAASPARHTLAFGNLLWAVEWHVVGATEVVVTGDRPDLVAEVHRRFLPTTVLAWGEPGDGPLWAGRDESGHDGRAYVCRDHACAGTGRHNRAAGAAARRDPSRLTGAGAATWQQHPHRTLDGPPPVAATQPAVASERWSATSM
ncbi:MAG: hypothetical protein V9E94_13435 [Microthrixaceae bacterium]